MFLDFFDFLTNSVMMPIAAICYLPSDLKSSGYEKDPEEEVLLENGTFRRKKNLQFYDPLPLPHFAAIILISSVANAFGWISM